MATMHLYAIGRVAGGQVDIRLAPRQQTTCNADTGCQCRAYSLGWSDAKAGRDCDALRHVSALCCVERYIMGWRDSDFAARTFMPQPPDGTLQRVIDEAEMEAELEDYREWMADQDYFRSGAW